MDPSAEKKKFEGFKLIESDLLALLNHYKGTDNKELNKSEAVRRAIREVLDKSDKNKVRPEDNLPVVNPHGLVATLDISDTPWKFLFETYTSVIIFMQNYERFFDVPSNIDMLTERFRQPDKRTIVIFPGSNINGKVFFGSLLGRTFLSPPNVQYERLLVDRAKAAANSNSVGLIQITRKPDSISMPPFFVFTEGIVFSAPPDLLIDGALVTRPEFSFVWAMTRLPHNEGNDGFMTSALQAMGCVLSVQKTFSNFEFGAS